MEKRLIAAITVEKVVLAVAVYIACVLTYLAWWVSTPHIPPRLQSGDIVASPHSVDDPQLHMRVEKAYYTFAPGYDHIYGEDGKHDRGSLKTSNLVLIRSSR